MKLCALAMLGLIGTLGCDRLNLPKAATANKPAPSLTASNEREIAYVLEREDQGQAKMTPESYQFHSGDRFRLRFRPGFPAYIYVANRGEHESSYHVLFPGPKERAQNPLAKGTAAAVPNDTEWLHFDQTPGNEFFYLIASSIPLSEFEESAVIPRDTFDVKLGQLERRYQPTGSRRFQDGDWTKFFAARAGDLALVVQLNLEHR